MASQSSAPADVYSEQGSLTAEEMQDWQRLRIRMQEIRGAPAAESAEPPAAAPAEEPGFPAPEEAIQEDERDPMLLPWYTEEDYVTNGIL